MKLFLKTTLFTVILILLFLSTAPGGSLAHATGRSEPIQIYDISIVQEEQHSKLSPAATAEGAVLMEQQTGKILLENIRIKAVSGQHQKYTALRRSTNLDEMVTVGRSAFATGTVQGRTG